MTKPVDFSPQADDEWDGVLGDRKLYETLDPLLDQIEKGVPGRRYADGKWFLTTGVPGRDDTYTIVWEDRGDHYYVLRIGRI